MSVPMAVGSIGWIDMTSPDPEAARAFYEAVVGWGSTALSMGDHDDYCMTPPAGGDPLAGICREQGSAATGLPPMWMIYIVVADLEAALTTVVERGGEVRVGPRGAGGGRYAVVRDPVGAYAALYEQLPTPVASA